jgi:hypothetical protein
MPTFSVRVIDPAGSLLKFFVRQCPSVNLRIAEGIFAKFYIGEFY